MNRYLNEEVAARLPGISYHASYPGFKNAVAIDFNFRVEAIQASRVMRDAHERRGMPIRLTKDWSKEARDTSMMIGEIRQVMGSVSFDGLEVKSLAPSGRIFLEDGEIKGRIVEDTAEEWVSKARTMVKSRRANVGARW